jgi:hypothetical protein
MGNMLKLIVLSILLLFTTINYGQKKGSSPPSIDIEGNMKNMEIVKLSKFISDISYVPFENKGEIFFTPFTDFDISDNLISVINYTEGCLLFDISGHFISRIGSIGRGPTEYIAVDLIGFDTKKNIFIRSQYDLFQYKTDGTFVKKYNKCFLVDDTFYLFGGTIINDSLILGHILNSTGDIKYKAMIVNKSGKAKYYSRNYEIFNPERKVVSSFEGSQTNLNKFNKTVFYKELYNDTLFGLNKELQLIPAYTFKFGKFKEPLSERAKLPPNRDLTKYLRLPFVYQTKDFLYLDCEFASYFPAKRLTPKKGPIDSKSNWYNTTKVLGIYDRRTGKLVFSKPTSTDNPLYTTGLYNDFDAGPRFFPIKQVNDSMMVMWIEAKQLKDHVASDDFRKNLPKYPERKKMLEKLANSLSEFDNPVLMLVTFK